MFSTAIRRVTPLVRQQARPRTASATYMQTAAASSSSSSPPNLTESEQTIYNKLTKQFDTSELLVQDISGGCGSFFAITIASKTFRGITVVKQHRLVNNALKEEIEGIHGLQLKTIPI